MRVNRLEVLKDMHAAELLQISVKKLKEVRRRNKLCFPIDFAFVTEKRGRAETWVFTLQGLLIMSALLKSDHAILLNKQLVEFLLKEKPGLVLSPGN